MVSGLSKIRYKRMASTGNVSVGMMFYDATKAYIPNSGKSGLARQPSNNPVDDEIDVPETAVYARFTYRKDTETYGDFSISGYSKIGTYIDDVKNDISELSENNDYIVNAEGLINFLGADRALSGGGTNASSIAFEKKGDMFLLNGVVAGDNTSGYYWWGLLSQPQPTRAYASENATKNMDKQTLLKANHAYEICLKMLSGETVGSEISLRMFNTDNNQILSNGCYINDRKTIYVANDMNVNIVLRVGYGCGFTNATIFVSLRDLTYSDAVIPLVHTGATPINNKLFGLDAELSNNSNYSTFEFYPVDNNYRYYVNQRCFVSQFSGNTYNDEIIRECYKAGSVVQLESDTTHVVISVYKSTLDTFCFHKLDTYNDKLFGDQVNNFNIENLSPGVINSIASARQFLNIEYTPVRRMPYCPGIGKKSFIAPGTVCRSIPYSSTGVLSKCVGQHVSFYTFLSAIQNPKSVLYTRRIAFRPSGSTYYGGTCFNFTSYAFGSKFGYYDNTYSHIDIDKDYTPISPYEMQAGDLIMASAHVAMITRVFRDEYGRIKNYVVAQSKPPFPHQKTHAFVVLDNGYLKFSSYNNMRVFRPNTRIDRRTGLHDYGSYVQLPYVKGFPDETVVTPTYPDIMPEYGDQACIEAGTDVIINVLDSTGYSSIEVYKNNTLIDTKNTVQDFTISNIAYGTYKFKLIGSSKTSESSLIVADVNGSFNSETNIVTFSSANATPIYVAAYADSDSYEEKNGVMHYVKRLKTSESNSGSCNVSDIVNARFPNVIVGFLTDYGVAVWMSKLIENAWESVDDNTQDVTGDDQNDGD